MKDEKIAALRREALTAGLDSLARLAGLELPDACRDGVLANLLLLDGHLRALRRSDSTGGAE